MKLYPFKILAVLLCLVFCLCQGSTAFAEDTGLRIPDGVTVIEAEAFFGCQNVSSVTIPASVKKIGNAAFVGCTGLKDVYYYGTESSWQAIQVGFGNEPLHNAALHFSVPIDATNFPDKVYRTFILENYDKDKNGWLSEQENSGIKSMALYKMTDENRQELESMSVPESDETAEIIDCGNIQSLRGIEFFTFLESLTIQNIQIAELDLSHNTALRVLSCTENPKLSSLNLYGCRALERLDCTSNQLTALNLRDQINMIYLRCGNNPLSLLNVTRCVKLQSLYAYSCALSSLDISKNPELRNLNLNNNSISTLNLSACTKLVTLGCERNNLGNLDLSRNTALEDLNLAGNQLTSLNVSHAPRLFRLWVHENRLSTIDISSCSELVNATKNGEKTEFQRYIAYRLGLGPYPSEQFNYNFVHDKTTELMLSKPVTLVTGMLAGGINIAEALNHASRAYEEATGKKVIVESLGGGIDIQATLNQYYKAGAMPDIFVCDSESDFNNWSGITVDMRDQAWAKDTEMGYIDQYGALIGFPYTVEAIGLAYNKDILQRAGVDPSSITGLASIKAAFEKINAQKAKLGITAVIGYCANATELYWSTGQHLFGQYLDAGLARDDTTYFDLLMQGKLDQDRFTAFAEMVDLFNHYSDPALLVSGNYDMQVSGFAAGKYAFVTQGSWIGSSLTNQYKDQYAAVGNFECGYVPYAFIEGIDTILTNAPSHWAVYKDGNVAEAEEFLNWLAGPDGQQIMVQEAGCVSPFKSCTVVTNDPFAGPVSEFAAAGKTSSWHWMGQPSNLAQDFGAIFQDYAMGLETPASFTEAMEDIIAGVKPTPAGQKIEIICPWGLGGGADSTIRPMVVLLQNELGVPVEVQNVTGGSGVNGATYAYKQPADGYTFLLGTQSLFIQDMLDNMDFNFKDEFECEDILVHSINMLAGSKKQMDKYGIKTFSDLKEYAAAHPYEVSVAMLTATGVDGMCFEIATEGLALNPKSYQGGSEVNSDMAGGHVDLAVGGYDDMSGLIESGDIIPLLVFCEHRIDIMPDCECTAELGIDSYAGPWRAIFAKKGTPQGAIDQLIDAVEKCREDATWKEFTKNAAYDQREVPAPGEELQTFCLNEYKSLRDYMINVEVLEKDYEDLK